MDAAADVDPHEINEIACELAAEFVKATIESCCQRTASGGIDWYDTHLVLVRDAEDVKRALHYLALLDNETAAYRLVKSKAFPRLVKFEEKPE